MSAAKTEASKVETPATMDAVVTTPATSEEKKRSKRLKNAHRAEKGMTKAARRLSKAISDGVKVWDERRDASASKKKDGSLRDLNKNLGKAVRKTLRSASKAPSDLVDALSKMSMGKGFQLNKGVFR